MRPEAYNPLPDAAACRPAGRQSAQGANMEQRKLGDGPLVGAIGFGCMGMSEFYGATDDDQSLATLEHAFEAGRHAVRHGRHLRLRPQRVACSGASSAASASASSSPRRPASSAASQIRPCGASTTPRPTWPGIAKNRCGGSARTMSTSTTCIGSIRRRRSRNPSTRSADSCAKARSAASAFPT